MKVQVQAIILAGGMGTRLMALYPDRPKALVPVCGKPFLQWQIEWLAKLGLTDIHLALGHMAELIRRWLREAPIPKTVALTCSVEPRTLGTAGAVKWAESYIRSDPFFVLNGDTYLPYFDPDKLLHAHQTGGRLATLIVTRVRKAGRFGTVIFDANHVVTGFHEKKASEEAWVNGGVYCLAHSLLPQIPSDKPVSMEDEVFPRLAAAGQLLACLVPPPLLDMGTPEGLVTMSKFFEQQGLDS
ncbi:MAG: sugar phosphate nucleotidyltransferase [Kiritimatiellae bacterium]|nr:sugar phosphate nucleotidyltransferase [Kiritimatiellia bacterium]